MTRARSAGASICWLVQPVLLTCGVVAAGAQELVPGEHTPAPVGLNVVTVATTFSRGDVAFEPSLPVEDARARLGVLVLGIGHTMSIAGRYANFGVAVPLVVGRVQGLVHGQFEEASREGNADMAARIAMNLYGAPAMTPREFAAYRPSTIVGTSFVVTAPTGQYDPARLLNLGTNRWAFKPEIGIAHMRHGWTFEANVSTVLFTDNTSYVGGRTREQAPVVAVQGHVIRTFRPGLWIAGDGNFWRGGRVTIAGLPALLEQRNSRVGITMAIPVRRHQMRVSYSAGAYTTIGGDYHSVGFSYSYFWLSR